MDPDPKLLDHPFYQAWERGEVTREQLAEYAAAYQEFMDRVPDYWGRVVDELDVDDPRADTVVAEEREHADLWREWRSVVDDPDDPPELADLFAAMEEMSPSELAGAVHAYESQQPAVAETKKAGLIDHYGHPESALTFFDEHMNEAEHIALGEDIRREHADEAAFRRGFRAGAQQVYNSLDAFTAG